MDETFIRDFIHQDSVLSYITYRIVYMNELPSVKTPKCFYIVNTAKSDGRMGHWVCFYRDRGGSEFYDSLHMYPGHYHPQFATWLDGAIRQVPYRIQDSHSDACGFHLLFYLLMKGRGYSLRDIVQRFSSTDLRGNDLYVKQFIFDQIVQ